MNIQAMKAILNIYLEDLGIIQEKGLEALLNLNRKSDLKLQLP